MIRRIEAIAGTLASIFLFALMILTFVDVVGRNVFSRPILGTTEVTEILLAMVIFLLLPQLAFRRQHITIDLIDQISGRRGRYIQEVFAAVLGAGLFFIIAWRLWILAGSALRYGDITANLKLPVYIVIYAIAALVAITGLGFAASLFTIRRDIAKPDDEDEVPFSV